MDNNMHRGAITVYLSIVLSAVILLSGVLMDIIRIRAAEAQVRRAVNTAAVSILAGYDTKLKQDYGLFALHNSSGGYLNEEIRYYLANQLMIKDSETNNNKMKRLLDQLFFNNDFKKVRFIDLFHYQIESVGVVPIYNLTENEITRQQIVEYMKYRGPAQLGENFLEKLDYAASAKEATTAYKKKTAIEKQLGKIEKAIGRLQSQIDIINSFNKKDFDSSVNSSSLFIRLCTNVVLKEIYSECSRANFGNLETPEERALAMKVRERIYEGYRDAVRESEDSKILLTDQVRSCINAVSTARQELTHIQALGRQIRDDIKRLKSYVQELDKSKAVNKIDNEKLIAPLQKDIAKYEKLLDEENTQSISDSLSKNFEILNLLQVNLNGLDSYIAVASRQASIEARRNLEDTWNTNVIDHYQLNQVISNLAAGSRVTEMRTAVESYLKVSNVMDKGKGSKGLDPRRSTAEAARKIRNEVQGTSPNPKRIQNPELLPSYFLNGSYPNKIFSGEASNGETVDRLPSVVEQFNADFGEDSEFVEAGFDFIIDFAERLQTAALNMRNEIYVNEYILNIFKDIVEIPGAATDGKGKGTFFEKAEVEYILCGNANEEVNKFIVKGQILLIRFGMNTLHIYTDPQKRTQALELATAVAGITGFGIPIAHNLIMCAWGTAEAFCDIEEIYDGKKVPFVKSVENWRTDLLPSGFKSKEAAETTKGLMDFDYHDYLRLLLLAKDKDVKLNRIQDLIQLNLQQSNSSYRVSGCNTYIKIDAQVSLKYWFITRLFVPSKYKTGDGNRHLIHVEVWRGY